MVCELSSILKGIPTMGRSYGIFAGKEKSDEEKDVEVAVDEVQVEGVENDGHNTCAGEGSKRMFDRRNPRERQPLYGLSVHYVPLDYIWTRVVFFFFFFLD